MSFDFDALTWSTAELGRAIAELVKRSGLGPRSADIPQLPLHLASDSPEEWSGWIEGAAGRLGVEAVHVQSSYANVEQILRAAGPALLVLPPPREPRVLAVIGARSRKVRILRRDRTVENVPIARVCGAMSAHFEEAIQGDIEKQLDAIGLASLRRTRARAGLTRERLGSRVVAHCWVLSAGSARFWLPSIC
ncbi:MAG: hypothetical protein HYX75_23365 [Acidobacteria bacterium]|nr:hypothetical protein [Acidobacteriota bacterium]